MQGGHVIFLQADCLDEGCACLLTLVQRDQHRRQLQPGLGFAWGKTQPLVIQRTRLVPARPLRQEPRVAEARHGAVVQRDSPAILLLGLPVALGIGQQNGVVVVRLPVLRRDLQRPAIECLCLRQAALRIQRVGQAN